MSICLTMIVRDEAPVIERCLRSVLPVVDRAAIVDTGSTDETEGICLGVCSEMAIPLSPYRRPWVDFATNRNDALELARRECSPGDYILMMDADHVWHGERPKKLDRAGYYVEHRYAGTSYPIACLMRADLPFRYVGVVHEYLACDGIEFATLHNAWVEVFHDGVRSRAKDTYDKDARLLLEALGRDPTNARTAFYYAQSLKDAGHLQEAYEAYAARSRMSGWDEERWYALLEMARLSVRLGFEDRVSRQYLAAFDARPSRAEPMVELAAWYRARRQFALASMFAGIAAAIKRPDDKLFVDPGAHDWKPLDELAISCWYTGHIEEGRMAAQQLIAQNRFPASERERILANGAFYGIK